MLLLSSTEVRVTLVQTVSEIPWSDMFLPLGTFLGKAVNLNVFLRVIGHGSKNGTACCKPRYGTLSQNGYGKTLVRLTDSSRGVFALGGNKK